MSINWLIRNKKILVPIILVFALILWIVANYWPWWKSGFLSFFSNVIPEVVWWNFDINYKKLPVSAKYIDFNFNTDLDKNSVNKQNLIVSPQIDWNIELIWKNIIRYTFLWKNEIWDQVEFTFKKDIKSEKWEQLASDISYLITITEDVKVTKILPEKNLDNLSQNIIVFFNIPVVALTNLEEKDQIPCPLEITPKIEWTCKWTTSSVLEFTPKTHFEWATKYNVKVINKEWLLYPIKETKEISFETTHLKYYLSANLPKDWIDINFNFPVNYEDLKSKITLFDVSSWTWKLDFMIEPKSESWVISETNFNIKLKNKDFTYSSNCNIEIKDWLKPKYWNIDFNNKDTYNERNLYFSNYLNKPNSAYRNMFSLTWSLINTQEYYLDNQNENNKFIPTKDLFFKLNFNEEIPLDNNLISFINTKTWKKINTKLSYLKEEIFDEATNTWKLVETKKLVKLDILEKLDNETGYSLRINKSANKYLKQDEVYNFITAPKPKLLDYKFIDYTKVCFYFNNSISDDSYNLPSSDYLITTNPTSKKAYINEWDNIPYDMQNLSRDELANRWYCKNPEVWEKLYILNTRLNPNTSYNIKLNNFEDKYGNKFEDKFEQIFKTWEIKAKDQYLYNSVNNEKQVIPANLPINLNLQTINLDKIDLEVCEMDFENYKNYLENNLKFSSWLIKNIPEPKCNKSTRKTLEVKNKNWNLSNNFFDLEKDVIWEKFSQNFILTYWYKPNWEKAFSNLYIRQDYNIVLENWKDNSLVFVTDMAWNQVKDVELNFFNSNNYQNPTFYEYKPKFNLNKVTWVYEIKNEQQNYSSIIIAKKDWKIWLIYQNEDDFNNYDFKYISWMDTAEQDYLYLFTERPIYKPGDEVYFKWILRHFTPNWYTKSSIKKAKLEIVDENYKMIKTIDINIDSNSNFDWKFTIPKEISTWRFSFNFKHFTNWNEAIVNNNAFFHIEEYTKPVFKINVEKNKTDFSLNEKAKFTIKPEYYFGWKVTNTTWKYSVLTQNYFFDAKEYSDYQFWEWTSYFDCIYWGYCSYDDYLQEEKIFNISSNWDANIEYDFSNKEAEKIYSFNFEVTDPNTQKTVNKSESIVLHNTDAYVWLKTPYFVAKNSDLIINWIVLDYKNNVLANKNVKIELIKRDWQVVKKQWVDWVFYNDYSDIEKLESSLNTISSNKWEILTKFKPKQSWEYLVKATYTWSNWKSFVTTSYIYVSWDDYIEWNNWNNTVTDLIADKNHLKIWEKASYVLKSPVNNWKALFVIEKDDAILDYFVHDIKSYSDKITIDVKNNYYPNYYVKAFLIWKQDKNPLPVYKRALISTKVDTEFKNLKISIIPEKTNYNPWDSVNISILVKDSLNKPVANANVFLSLVDESLLALVGNPKKNPYAFFYDMKRYLWISTYSNLKFLIEKLEVKDARDGEKWWAWDRVKWWDTKKKRWRFEDTAFLRANLTTDSNWIAKINIAQLPDNLTTWVIEAIVNTSDTKVWVGYNTILTAKPLQISDNLPNFLVSKDRIIFSPVIFNKTWKAWDFEITFSWSNLEILDWNSKKIFLWKDEQKTVNFEAKIVDIWVLWDLNKAISTINIKAKTSDNSYIDEIEKTLQIKENSTLESVSTTGKTKTVSNTEKISLSWLKNKIWALKLNYSSTILSNLLSWIDYLNNFPYGCSEQKTSAIMPNIFIKSLYNSAWVDFDLKTKYIDYYDDYDKIMKKKSVDEVIKDYLIEIRKYQKLDWWFVYFYDADETYYPNYSDFHLTSYILEAWAKIRSIWYKLEETNYFNAVAYLKKRFYENKIEWCEITKYNDCKYSETDKLKALNSILEFTPNDYEVYKMYKLLNFKDFSTSENLEKVLLIWKLLKLDISTEEKANLEKEAKEIVDNILTQDLVYNPKWAYIWKTNSYSRLSNTTELINAISSVWIDKFKDIDMIIDNLNRWVISQKSNWNFGSTYDNIQVIEALTSYLNSSNELKNVNINSKFKLNSELIDEKNIDDKNKLEIFSKILPLNNLKDENDFNVEKTWNWNIYYDLSLNYYLDTKDIKARDEWFSITREYYNYEEYKNILHLKKEEWQKYLENKISYNSLKYPKQVYEYIKPITTWKVWELLMVRNKVITTETRDKVAFEWFITAWSELVNPNLATSTKIEKEKNNFENEYDYYGYNLFNKIEYRTDRYFAYTNTIYPWIYDFDYVIRLTYSWDFNVRPSKISEFYNPEVFGRTAWEVFSVSK